jgi:hypothetical protein
MLNSSKNYDIELSRIASEPFFEYFRENNIKMNVSESDEIAKYAFHKDIVSIEEKV